MDYKRHFKMILNFCFKLYQGVIYLILIK